MVGSNAFRAVWLASKLSRYISILCLLFVGWLIGSTQEAVTWGWDRCDLCRGAAWPWVPAQPAAHPPWRQGRQHSPLRQRRRQTRSVAHAAAAAVDDDDDCMIKDIFWGAMRLIPSYSQHTGHSFLTCLHPYLSFPLRIDPLCFQASCRNKATKPGFRFCVYFVL